MAIPNYSNVVADTARDYPELWRQAHTGSAQTDDFIKVLAARLHALDARFGNNGKRGNPADLSDDAINFKGEQAGGDYDPTDPGAKVTVIDVIAGAGGPNPQPAWLYPLTPAAAAWVKPGAATGGGGGHVCPTPVLPPYPGDQPGWDLGAILEADYREAGRPGLDAGSGTWFNRALYDYLAGMPFDQSVAKHRKEWREALGLPAAA